MADQAREVEWVRQARKGQYEAFEQLVAAYQRQVYTLALRIVGRPEDAEEVVQESFLSVIDHLEELREAARFRPWLMGIATNHALMLLRKRKVRAARSLDAGSGEDENQPFPEPDFIASWSEDPQDLAVKTETQRILTEALDALNEKHRAVFVLRDIEGMTTEQTAKALGISTANAKVRLLRARLALREHLTRHFGDEATRLRPGPDHDG